MGERGLVLWSAGTAARRASGASAARQELARADCARLQAELERLRMVGIGGPRLVEIGAPPALARFVADFRAVAARHGVLREFATLRVLRALEDAGIPAAALKGPPLARRLYGDAGARASHDIDVLVAPEHLARAVAVAAELGYARPADRVDRAGRPLLHFALPGAGDVPDLELHWRVHWYEERFAPRALARSRPAEDGRRFQPPDELAMLLLFYARDGFAGLRLAADVAAWWDRCGAELDPGALAAIARAEPGLDRALATASRVAARTTGVPDLLAGRPASRLAARIANWPLAGSTDQLRADQALVDLLLAPPGGRAAFVRRQVLMPRAAVAEWLAPARVGRVRLRAEQALRPLKLAVRWSLALRRALSPSGPGWRRCRS